MEPSKNFKANINDASQGQVVRQKDPKTASFSLLFLILGIAMIVGSGYVEDNTSTLYMSLLALGVIAVIGGGFRLLFGCKRYVFLPTKSPVDIESFFFEPTQLQTLSNAFESGEIQIIKSLKRKENTGVRVDVISSADNQFAATQVFQYIPHNYEPVTPIYCMYEGKAKELTRVFDL